MKNLIQASRRPPTSCQGVADPAAVALFQMAAPLPLFLQCADQTHLLSEEVPHVLVELVEKAMLDQPGGGHRIAPPQD